MTRIANLAIHQSIVGNVLRTQQNVFDAELQVATEKKSPVYRGIANESQRLLSLENQSDIADRFVRDNEVQATRLKTQSNVTEAARQVIDEFRKRLVDLYQNEPTDQSAVDEVQDWAIRAMTELEGYLNTKMDGQYIFSGSRTDQPPVNLGVSTRAAFQTKYDGSSVTYPTYRDTHIHSKLTAGGGFPSNPTGAGYTTLDFTDAGDTITAANAGAFANLPVGETITISGTTGGTYDGTYTITANTGTVLTVSPALAAGDLAGEAGVTINGNTSYYQGDETVLSHRLDETREFSLDLNAIDPAFEKAIRAMGIIAQGAFGTAGGLDQNTGRVANAIYLLASSLDEPVDGVAPFGAEQTGNITKIEFELGFKQVQTDDTINRLKSLSIFLGGQAGNIENVDKAEAITLMMDESRQLEISYNALARIRQLSLADYLK